MGKGQILREKKKGKEAKCEIITNPVPHVICWHFNWFCQHSSYHGEPDK